MYCPKNITATNERGLCFCWGPSQHVHFFYTHSHLGHGTGTVIYQPIFYIYLKYIYPSTQFTILIVYWDKLKKYVFYSCVKKRVPVLCLLFWYFSKKPVFYFSISKELTNIKGILM